MAIAAAHPGDRLELWCEDEARIGQKGRTCHRWHERGMRPPGPADRRFESLYVFAACRPGTDQACALALPEATITTGLPPWKWSSLRYGFAPAGGRENGKEAAHG